MINRMRRALLRVREDVILMALSPAESPAKLFAGDREPKPPDGGHAAEMAALLKSCVPYWRSTRGMLAQV